MTEIVFLGGLLNFTDPIFHLQVYIWLWVMGLIGAVVLFFVLRHFGWMPYKPLHGLYYAAKAGSGAAFTFGTQLYMELLSEAEAKCIFNYGKWSYELPPSRMPGFVRRLFFNYASAFLDDLPPGKALAYKFGGVNLDVKIAKHLQNGEWEEAPSVTIGGTPTDLILDADQWTIRDSPQHKAIEEAALKWNEAHPEDQVHSFMKFQRLVREEKIEPPPGVKMETVIPWTRIDTSFPVEHQDNEYAGYRRTLAEEMGEAKANEMKNLGIKILLLCFGLAFVILIFRHFS